MVLKKRKLKKMLNYPVLIYVSKDTCPACIRFNKDWEIIKKEIKERAICVKFVCTNNSQIPFSLLKYFQPQGVFPTILLAGPKSYFRAFTINDKINDPNYTIKAKKFNSVEVPGGYEYAGRNNDKDNVLLWFDQIVDTIPAIDEKTLPPNFSS